MSTSFLSVDLGNSRCKLCLWKIWSGAAAELRAAHELESRPGIAAHTLSWLATHEPADSAAISSVAARTLEDELCSALESRVRGRVTRRPDPGFSIACREPDAVGGDRLFAARGAYELVKSSVIVVDAGTALTVDVLQVAQGRVTFLGGAIAPGPKLLSRALASGTARLKLIEPLPGVESVGRDTEAALQAGVVHGFRGAARELVERVGIETDLSNAPVVLTGGARIFLSNPYVFGTHAVHEDSDLVHRGLIAASFIPFVAP